MTHLKIMPQSDTTDAIMADAPAPTSISAAAHQYQMAMSQQEAAQATNSVDLPSSAFEPSGETVAIGSNPDMSEVCYLILIQSASC